MATGGHSSLVSINEVVEASQRQVRADYFVGRDVELGDFAKLLHAGETPLIVFVHGPGGIGKSSLLEAFGAIAGRAGSGFASLDARQMGRSPRAIGQAVTQALADLPAGTGRVRVLALDHVEKLSALDDWLRHQLLPHLPSDLLLVLAGREGPNLRWRADPGITVLLREYALAPLAPAQVFDYLRRRGVPEHQRSAVQAFSGGYPLPLALAADQVLRKPDRPFDIDDLPHLVQGLVQWLLGEVDHPDEFLALQACATMRRLDEPLLAAMLGRDDVRAQFDWLAAQNFVEWQTRGLVIHDLVRDVVIRDLRCRNLALHHDLIRRAFRHLLATADLGLENFRIHTVPEILYALRHEPHIRKHLGFGFVRGYPAPARVDEVADLAAEVERLEGGQSRAWFEHWSREPGSELLVIRSPDQEPIAFALFLRLTAADLAGPQADPCLTALQRHLQIHAPLRETEQVLLARFRMVHETHQALTPAWAELAAHMNGRMFTPGISLFASVADTRYDWSGMEENAEYRLAPDSEYRMDELKFMLSAHDLRREPALAWAYNSVERVLRGGLAPELKPPPIMLLDKAAFADAVQKVLRHYHDECQLADSPLLHSPMLRRHAQRCDAEALRELLERTSASQSDGHRKLLDQVYFHPIAAKQQAIASKLHISERTLRRRLRDAQDRLIEKLWALDTTP